MNSEWIQEGETSSEIIQFHAPSFTIPCFVRGAAVTAFYNPIVGVNIISASFASDYLGERHVTPTTKSLRIGLHSIIKGIGIMQCAGLAHENGDRFRLSYLRSSRLRHPNRASRRKTFSGCFYSRKDRCVSWGKSLLLAYQLSLFPKKNQPRRCWQSCRRQL